MYIRILCKGTACSTLTIADMFTYSYEVSKTLDDFKKAILSSLRMFDENAKENKNNGYGDYHQVESFAFFFVSTIRSQSKEQGFLRQLGFTSTTEQYNYKNGTYVTLWTIPAQQLLKELNYEISSLQ